MKKIVGYFLVLTIACVYNFTVFAQVTRVESVGITVNDMNRSLKFYTEVLGFKKVSEAVYKGDQYEKLEGVFGLNIRVARLRLGDEIIELTDFLTTGGRSIPEDQRSNDLFFQHIAIVVSDMDKAYQQLKDHGVEHVSTSPQTLPASIPAAAGIKAFYFHDPDGHNLELIFFPAGKGDPKWQNGKAKVFLGIDHTAIGVRNTETSHKFYSSLLGLERKGDSWNKGIEQEHLNNVEGASLHITGYRAAAGPGVEFLEYLDPGPGRSYPADSRADDIWHWQTTLIVDDARNLYNTLKAYRYKFVSKELIQLENNGQLTPAFIVRDPDGHALLIIERKN